MNVQFLRGASSGVAFLIALGAPAAAQFGNEWVSFVNETPLRFDAAPNLSSADPEEKDYDWADLDQDGWTDLVVVRKKPATVYGPHQNVLFMNEAGVLTDRTAQYASASDVAGDQGFLTPTNDRDVEIADVDLDGWLDVITAPALGHGNPKHITHPRVYLNLGSAGGWAGFEYQDARIPQFISVGGIATATGFCGVSAGDVTGDGYPDLHFADYDSGGAAGANDLDDRLLINDGAGFFADESNLRMTSAMLSSGFGTSTAIVELNQLPGLDILKNESSLGEAYYNDPNNVGTFNVWESFHPSAAYHTSAGDLNNDGRIDALFSDDGSDRYRYNLGTDPLGRVIWGSGKTFQFLTGGDDGFGGTNLIVDLDGDGWKDAIVTDVDVDVPGCSRRTHIYRNPGGVVGSEITLREEAGGSGSGDWRGAKGILAGDLRGGFDVAVFDIDNDGDNDMVLGRCAGTFVWMNEASQPVCQTDLGFGGPSASISLCGSELSSGLTSTLVLESFSASAGGMFAIGPVANPTFIPLLGATVVPWVPTIFSGFQTDAGGTFSTQVSGGGGPATWYIQAVVIDPAEPTGIATSNALEVQFLP